MSKSNDPMHVVKLIQTEFREEDVIDRLNTYSQAEPDVLPKALEELHNAFEELKIAEEQLRLQCDELAQSQTALEKHKQRYQELFDLAPGAIVVTDRFGAIREANFAACRLLGVAGKITSGRPLATFVHTSDKQAFRDWLSRVIESSQTEICEIKFDNGAREPITASVIVSPIVSRDQYSLHWTLANITADKLMEAQKAQIKIESEARAELTNVLERVTDAIFALDRDLRITFVNRQAALVWNMQSEEFIGRSLGDFTPDGLDGEYLVGQIRTAIERQRPVEFEAFVPCISSWLEIKAYPSAKGVTVYCHGIDHWKKVQSDANENIRREHSIAEMFQQHLLLTPSLHTLPGLTIEAFYSGAIQELCAGGDFYDVLDLDDGRVALAVGDATGKGLAAATFAIELKQALRVFLWTTKQPGLALSKLNDYIVKTNELISGLRL